MKKESIKRSGLNFEEVLKRGFTVHANDSLYVNDIEYPVHTASEYTCLYNYTLHVEKIIDIVTYVQIVYMRNCLTVTTILSVHFIEPCVYVLGI